MTSFTKSNISSVIGEVLIVVVGVTIAFWVEQYRENLNSNDQLTNSLIDIEESLKNDSVQITSYNYDEIRAQLRMVDTAIILLQSRKTIDLRQKPNILSQPLMDFSNNTLDAFIKSESFAHLNNSELKREMIFYRLFASDLWEKEKRFLDYLLNSIVPSLHKVADMYSESKQIQPGNSLTELELIKLENDLRMIRDVYNNGLTQHWPYLVERNSKLRSELRKELKKG